jgi:hypothetical protein
MSPERRLAHAVLLLAAHDAAHAVVPQRRESARQFLSGGPMLAFWCAVAGLNPARTPATRPDFPPTFPLDPSEKTSPRSTVGLARDVNTLDTGVTRAFGLFSGEASASPGAGRSGDENAADLPMDDDHTTPRDHAATIGEGRRVSPTFVVRRRGDFEGERLDF